MSKLFENVDRLTAALAAAEELLRARFPVTVLTAAIRLPGHRYLECTRQGFIVKEGTASPRPLAECSVEVRLDAALAIPSLWAAYEDSLARATKRVTDGADALILFLDSKEQETPEGS